MLTCTFYWKLSSKKSTCNAGYSRSIPGLGRSPGKGNDNPWTVFFPGKYHGQRNLQECGPWGHKRVRHSWAHRHRHMLVIIKRTSLLVKIAFKASEVKFCLLCEDTQFHPILNCINQILLFQWSQALPLSYTNFQTCISFSADFLIDVLVKLLSVCWHIIFHIYFRIY